MKKIVFLSILLTACIFTGCKPQTGDNSVKVLKNVSSLFIINPTENDKGKNKKWFEISSKSRTAETPYEKTASKELSVSLKDIGIYTPAFDPVYPEIKKNISRSLNSESPSKPEEVSYKVGDNIRLIDSSKNPFDSFFSQLRKFECIYEGEHCYIWICRDEDPSLILTDEEAVSFARKFDSIYERETVLCGPKYDGSHVEGITGLIAPNKKISLLFNDIGEDGATARYGGYQSPSDMFRSGLGIEAIHLDSYLAKKEPNYMYSATAHEFNHKLNFDNKYIKYGLSMDLWYTEMLSLMIEDFMYEELGLQAIDSSQSRLYMFIKGSYEYGFKNWDRSDQTAELSNYANAYAFGAFLARNYGGADLIHEICTNEFVNEESVVKAVNKINKTNKTFEDLLKEFPAILINTYYENSSIPSLNKSTINNIEGFDFKLNKINPKSLGGDYELTIIPNEIKLYDFYNFRAYGFQYYSFDKPTNVNLWKEDFVIYAAY